MSDDKGQDEKLLGVPVDDPRWNEVQSLEDIPEHTLREIEHFFKVYKDLENKETTIDGWKDKKEAVQLYHECVTRFKEQVNAGE